MNLSVQSLDTIGMHARLATSLVIDAARRPLVADFKRVTTDVVEGVQHPYEAVCVAPMSHDTAPCSRTLNNPAMEVIASIADVTTDACCMHDDIELESNASVGVCDVFDERHASNETPLPVLSPEEVFQNVCELVEFYFAESNYSKDQFLRKKAQQDPMHEGWIPVDLFCSFKKMKKFTEDREVILKAFKLSPLVVVSEDGARVRRKEKLTKGIEVRCVLHMV